MRAIVNGVKTRLENLAARLSAEATDVPIAPEGYDRHHSGYTLNQGLLCESQFVMRSCSSSPEKKELSDAARGQRPSPARLARADAAGLAARATGGLGHAATRAGAAPLAHSRPRAHRCRGRADRAGLGRGAGPRGRAGGR